MKMHSFLMFNFLIRKSKELNENLEELSVLNLLLIFLL